MTETKEENMENQALKDTAISWEPSNQTMALLRDACGSLAVIARALDDLDGAFVRRTETVREDGQAEVHREPEVIPVTTEGNDFLRVDQ